MNNINDKIDIETIGVRTIYPQQLFGWIMKSGSIAMSWGLHAPTYYKDKWIRFKVNGHHHKGHVYIALAFSDTFTIYYTTTKGTIVDKQEDVYNDQLIEMLDNRIEKIEDYAF